jgi:hypothetical protein
VVERGRLDWGLRRSRGRREDPYRSCSPKELLAIQELQELFATGAVDYRSCLLQELLATGAASYRSC